MSEEQVLDAIEHYFDHHQPTDYHLMVVRQGVRRDGDWWYVAVKPDRSDIRARDYSDLMDQAEEELEAQSNLKILLLPVLPGD